jgi:beta-glucosidase
VRDIGPGYHSYAANSSQAAVDALNAGCDVNDGMQYNKYLVDAVARGAVTERRLDEALTRFLAQRFLAGSFDDPSTVPWTQTPPSVCASPPHRALALNAARGECM